MLRKPTAKLQSGIYSASSGDWPGLGLSQTAVHPGERLYKKRLSGITLQLARKSFLEIMCLPPVRTHKADLVQPLLPVR